MAPKSIGFRATPRGFLFAVVSGSRAAPVLEDHGNPEVPKSFGFAEGLRFLEDECTRLLQEHAPMVAAVREAEYSRAQGGSSARARCRVEGVLMAGCARSGVPAESLLLASIGSRLGVKKPKELLGSDDLRALDWATVKTEGREAILAAVSGLE